MFDDAQLRRLRATHVHLCIPCYGGMLTEATFKSVLDFVTEAMRLQVPWSLNTMVNESLIPRGRNNLVAKMMANAHATHLLFVDADIRFRGNDVMQLLLHGEDVVGGCCPAKTLPPSYVLNQLEDGERRGHLIEVTTLGTGFLLIARSVLTRMFEAYPETRYIDSLGMGAQYEPFLHALFDTAIDDAGRYLSEDWCFCIRWRNLGGRIWADRRLVLDHIGHHAFAGDPGLLAEL